MEQKYKIMIIDDNPMDQLITKYVLKKEYAFEEVMLMASALAALEYLEANQDNIAALPNLILLDLDMPELNGFGFLDRFSTFAEVVRNTCKIVVLTASEVSEDIALMQADPHVFRLIPKPLMKSSLLQMA
jgi:CheY-like chemotaxis protein